MRKIGFTAFIGWAVSAALLIAGCVPPPSPPGSEFEQDARPSEAGTREHESGIQKRPRRTSQRLGRTSIADSKASVVVKRR